MALVTRPEFLLEIVESAREHGRATMVNDMKLNAANRNKLKQHFWNQPLLWGGTLAHSATPSQISA